MKAGSSPANPLLLLVGLVALAWQVSTERQPELKPEEAALYIDFEKQTAEPPDIWDTLRFIGAARNEAGRLELSAALDRVELDGPALEKLARRLNGIQAMTVGGWFLPRRTGEQTLFARGAPRAGPQGERMFPPSDRFVSFCLGTDQRGFLYGAVNGSGRMPFPYVTLAELPINRWHQLAVVKDAAGHQKFYVNGLLMRTDQDSAHAPLPRPFRETEAGLQEPVRLSVPLGGEIGEAWVYPRELTPGEIEADCRAKRDRYRPDLPVKPVLLREMNIHPAAWIRLQPRRETWPEERRRILARTLELLGPFPAKKVPLDARLVEEVDCGEYVRRKVSIQVQPGDWMPAYLLIPRGLRGRAPAVICFYGTTSGAGKETTVGLSGGAPGTPPEKNRAFALDVVRAGFVALAPDYLRDGERIRPGLRPYDTSAFYREFPDWSTVGKDVWDTMRAVDYLQSQPFVDARRIGMVGHSYGGHTTIFAAALEPRIRVVVSNGPVSDFLHYGMHWGVPKGAANSQSLPALRPYVLDHTLEIPLTFYELTALIAPRPLLVGQAAGERRPHEEENYAAVRSVYEMLGRGEQVRYHWYAGDHDFPPEARAAAVSWFRRWFNARDRSEAIPLQGADSPSEPVRSASAPLRSSRALPPQ